MGAKGWGGGISELIKQSAGDTWQKKDEMEGKMVVGVKYCKANSDGEKEDFKG